MRPLAELCEAVDDALARAAFARVSDGFILRKYEGKLHGLRARAALSVFMDTGTQHRLTSGLAVGYDLSLECDNGLPTRYLVGKQIPLLLGLGLTRLAPTTLLGSTVLVDDVPWFSKHVSSEAQRPAWESVAAESSFIEQKPGILRIKFTRMRSTDLPPLASMLQAFALLVSATLAPPAPRQAASRLSDNRSLMMALVVLAVLGAFASCCAAYYWLVR